MKDFIISIRKYILLILIAILMYWSVFNFGEILGVFNTIINVISPFLIGIVLAYIINIPMTKIENLLTKHTSLKKGFKRVISIIISLFLVLFVLGFVLFLLVPELIASIKSLADTLPILIKDIEIFILGLVDKYPEIQMKVAESFKNASSFSSIVTDFLNYVINGTIGIVSSIVSGLITFFTAVVFAIYMLSQKEGLLKKCNSVLEAYLSTKMFKKVSGVFTLSNRIFSKFISGQCLDATILGCLLFVALTIFRMPYALLIAVLTTITALIPIFGALIAMVVGAVLIAINNPMQALLFILVFQVIQQIEGNLIYPKIVGSSVGLSPIITLLAITVGGNLFGLVGMIMGVPIASIIYTLINENVNKKLSEKKRVKKDGENINS